MSPFSDTTMQRIVYTSTVALVLLCSYAGKTLASASVPTVYAQLVPNSSVYDTRESSAEATGLNAAAGNAESRVQVAVLSGEALFRSGSGNLTDRGVVALRKLLVDLDVYGELLSIRITGHTDSVGATTNNQLLSEKRAQSVEKYFIEKYPALNIVAIGIGENSPVASNATVAGRRLNRRVEIQVVAADSGL